MKVREALGFIRRLLDSLINFGPFIYLLSIKYNSQDGGSKKVPRNKKEQNYI